MEREIINWLEGRRDGGELCSLLGEGEITALLLYGSRYSSEDYYGAVSEIPLHRLASAEAVSSGRFSWVQTREGWVMVLLRRVESAAGCVALLAELMSGEENFAVTNDLKGARKQYIMLQEKRLHMPPPQKVLVAEVCRYIEKHLEDAEISLSSIAEQFFISEGYLSKEFKKCTGMPFSEYLIQKRIDTAKQMLKNRYVKVCDVARLTGFNSQHYFCTVFKKKVGVTPSKFRDID